MLNFSTEQIDKLSDLLMDLGKALLVSALLIRAVESASSIFEFLKGIIGGLFFVFLSLKILEVKKLP